jgi:uncharacterized NAD(P)/FAD-binding protein YdhS
MNDKLSFLNEERGESAQAKLPQTTSISDVRHFEAPYKSSLTAHYSERLMVQKRRYRSICAQGAGFVVESSSRDLVCRDEFDAVFDCRGLWTDLLKSGNSLVQSIIDEGLGMPDTLHLGFCCADSGRVINVSGDDKPALYTLGSLRRGELWETTAAREIRIQAATIAGAIVRE